VITLLIQASPEYSMQLRRRWSVLRDMGSVILNDRSGLYDKGSSFSVRLMSVWAVYMPVRRTVPVWGNTKHCKQPHRITRECKGPPERPETTSHNDTRPQRTAQDPQIDSKRLQKTSG